MAKVREATEEELQGVSGSSKVRPATVQDVPEGESALRDMITSGLGAAEEGARRFNIGMLEPLGLRSLANRIGVARPQEGDEDPSLVQSATEMAGTTLGTGAMMLAPGLRALSAAPSAIRETARMMPGLRPAASEFSRRAAESAARRPGAFWGIELGAGAAAGAAGEGMSRVTDSPTARLVAETLAGGGVSAAPATLSAAVRHAPSINIARNAIKVFRAPEAPTRETQQRAAGRLGRAVPDARDTTRRAAEARQNEVLEDAPLSLGELANEPGLLSLQRAVADSSEGLTQANQERFAEINRITQNALRTLTDTESGTRVDPQETRRYLETLMDERIRIARTAVDERLQQLGPRTGRETANRLAREELDNAYEQVLNQERELWGAVNLTDPVRPANTRDTYAALLNDIKRSRVASTRRDIPTRVREFFGSLDPETGELTGGSFFETPPSARDLHELRGELLDTARRERAKPAPNRRKLRAMAQIQESLLDDLSGISGSEQLDTARAFSRDLNERFRQGEVGDLLGFDVEGGRSLPEMLTLESTIGARNLRGAEATDQLMSAVRMAERDPQMKSHMESFLTDEFMRAARNGDELNPRKAAAYIQRRQDILRRFPELRQRFVGATESGEALQLAEAMGNPKQSAAALVIGAPPGDEMQRLLRTKNPREASRDLLTLLDKDETGRAKQGMRSAVADWLLNRSLTRFQGDVADRSFLSGRRLRETMEDPAVKQVVETILTPTQQDRLRRITNTATRTDIARRAESSPEGVLGDREALMMQFMRRFGAAAGGRAAGRAVGSGGTVQIPGQAVQLSEELVRRGLDPARKLVIDAVMAPDDALLRTLLMETPLSARRQDIAHKQINAWAAAVAAEYGMQLERDPPQE